MHRNTSSSWICTCCYRSRFPLSIWRGCPPNLNQVQNHRTRPSILSALIPSCSLLWNLYLGKLAPVRFCIKFPRCSCPALYNWCTPTSLLNTKYCRLCRIIDRRRMKIFRHPRRHRFDKEKAFDALSKKTTTPLDWPWTRSIDSPLCQVATALTPRKRKHCKFFSTIGCLVAFIGQPKRNKLWTS